MLLLEPVSNYKIWGTPRLHEYGGDSQIRLIGSVYSASAIKEIQTKIIYDSYDSFKNQTFYNVVQHYPELFGLDTSMNEYPLIVSITGADQNLSIQVHPTDEYAQYNEEKRTGKSESWYFIDSPDYGWIYAETKIEDKKTIPSLIEKGKIDDVVNRIKVDKGQLIYIPSGTLHALTKGSIVYEVQQSTDITYRFYDYNRIDTKGQKRVLHLNKAIETLKVNNNINIKNFNIGDNSVEREYRLDLLSIEKCNYVNHYDIAQIITVIEGTMIVQDIKVTKGKSMIVLPFESVKIKGEECKVIIATPKIYF